MPAEAEFPRIPSPHEAIHLIIPQGNPLPSLPFSPHYHLPPPAPPQAMVGPTSPRSDSLSAADAASGGSTSSQKAHRSIVIHGHVLNGRSKSRRGLMAGLAPQNAWVSRGRQPRADLIADSNDTAASPSGRSTLAPSPAPASSSPPSSQPKASARTSSNVPVAAITCAAVGGVIVVAAVLALIYFFRIRRRVKRMKRCTDILGPGASFKHSAAALN